jgi:hypothetical protein
MAIAKALAKSLAILAALYVCFRYLGDFPSKQSAVLTFVAWLGYELYLQLKASRAPNRGRF